MLLVFSTSRSASCRRRSMVLTPAAALLLACTVIPSIAVAAGQRREGSPQQVVTPSAAEAPAALRVSVASSIDDAMQLSEWLMGRDPDVSGAIAWPGHEQWIAVRIDGTTYDYHVSVTAMRDGEPISPSSAPLACECTTDALLSLIDGELARAVYRLRSTPIKGGQAGPTAVVPGPEPAPRPPTSEGDRPRRWTISRWGIAGAAMGAFGLVGLGAGTSLVVAEERQIEGWSKLYRELDPLGYATLSVGAAALAGGVAMLVVDGIRLRREQGAQGRAKRSRRARPAAAKRSIGLVPVFDARTFGMTFCERF